MKKIGLTLAVVLLTSCAAPASPSIPASASQTTAIATPSATTTTTVAVVGAACTSSGGLPDRTCTPGATNPDVTQATISITICRAGYTTTVRPAATYTNGLKVDQMKAYGLAAAAPGDYEEDHLIPLELGGDPRDPKNLWPELMAGPNGAAEKDKIENWAHDEVCAGRITLADAQRQIAENWIVFGRTQVVPLVQPAQSAQPSAAAALSVNITASRYGLVTASSQNDAQCSARAKLPSGNFSTAQGLAPTKIVIGLSVSWSYTTSTQATPGTGTHMVSCTLGGVTVTQTAPFQVP